MFRKVYRLRHLSFLDWLLLLQLLPVSMVVTVGAFFLPLSRLTNGLTAWATHPWLKQFPFLRNRYDLPNLLPLVYLAARTTRGSGCCLPQALLTFWLLKIKNEPAQLIVGVTKKEDQFSAHAWVEAEGAVIGDSPETIQSYSVLLRLA